MSRVEEELVGREDVGGAIRGPKNGFAKDAASFVGNADGASSKVVVALDRDFSSRLNGDSKVLFGASHDSPSDPSSER